MKKIVIVISCLLFAVVVVNAQTDCESMLEAANKYYNEGNFEKAAKMYQLIQKDCGSNFGGAVAKLKDCNHKLKEDEDFGKCTTLAACKDYLKNYPDGRYVDRVQQIRDGIIKSSVNVAEDDKAFQECITKEDYMEYLRKHPYGRHFSQARAIVTQFEEDELYENCTTESNCDAYLKAYPNGRYYMEVLEMKNAFEEERLRKERKAAETAYMNIKEIDFANAFAVGDVIAPYGSSMYVSEIRYLAPRITYDALLDDTRLISLFCKIIRPDGSLMNNSESPSGYTFSTIFRVQMGNDNLYELPRWGSDDMGSFDIDGTYRFELWFSDHRVYQTSFVVEDRNTPLSRGKWRTALKKCCDNVTYRKENGSFYKGQTYYGTRLGLGLYCLQGIFYDIGIWQGGKLDGMGITIASPGSMVSNCTDCEYYVGEFSSGEKSGRGSCYDKYGNLLYRGSFANNAPVQTYPTIGYDSYKFECIEYSSGDYYVGETYNEKPHGMGIFVGKGGDMWYGEWKYGNREGYGIYMPYQGDVSTGTWKNDTQQ